MTTEIITQTVASDNECGECDNKCGGCGHRLVYATVIRSIRPSPGRMATAPT